MSGIEFIDIPFGPYLPDLGGAPNSDVPGYLTDAVGVRLTPNGYRGLPNFEDVPSAAACGTGNLFQQAFGPRSSTTRNFYVLNDTDGKIYESLDDGVTWTDVSPAAGTAVAYPASFLTFEGEVIFVCPSRAPIYKIISAGTGTRFANLPGSPPQANCGAQVRQHVVLGALAGVDNYAVQWCAIGDSHDWPTPGTDDARSKQSGRETLPQSCGIVTDILGGEKFGIAVQQRGLTRMTYEGGDTVYSFDTYETKIGSGDSVTLSRPNFTTDGRRWYWANENGVFATDGYSVEKLDDGRIEDASVNMLYDYGHSSEWPLVSPSAAYDPHRHLVFFGSPTPLVSEGLQLCYSIDTDSFSWANNSSMRFMFSGFSASSLPRTINGNTLYNINSSTRKLQILLGGNGFGRGNTVAMQTGYIEIDPGYEVQLEGVHLLGSLVPTNSTVPESLAVGYKAAASYATCDLVNTGFTATTAQSRGMKNSGRSTAQFFSFRVTGTSSERQLMRGLRIYYSRSAPSQ